MELTNVFRLLGDDVRLRLLRVLNRERLNVSELTSVLGIAQSGVSRHLGLLKDAGLVEERRAGGYSFYGPLASETGPLAVLGAGLQAHFSALDHAPTGRADDARLSEVLRHRKESFQRHGGEDGGQLVPGRSWAAWSRALGLLLDLDEVADLGCGEGYLTLELARFARHVTAVDQSPEVLQRARQLAARRHVRNISWNQGDLEHVPLAGDRFELTLLSQALHHARVPQAAVDEAVRLTRPGGSVLVLELAPHGEEWVRERLGDRWLGFSEDDLAGLLQSAGLEQVRVGVGARLRGDPFGVLIARGRKAGAPAGNQPDGRRKGRRR